MTQSRLFKILVGTLAVIVLGVVLSGSEEEGPARPTPESSELEAVLKELRRTWKPGEKVKVFKRAAGNIERLMPSLLALLHEPSHSLIVEAVQLAAALKVEKAHPALVSLAHKGPESVRPGAILAVNRLQPWDRDALVAFLVDDTPSILIAALKISSSRTERPFPQIINLFGHEDPGVREAASQAIPDELGPEVLEQLLATAQMAIGDRGEGIIPGLYVIRILGRAKPNPKVEAFLMEQLEAQDRLLRIAALDALAAQGAPLHKPELVWKLVGDGEDPVVRGHALSCLERTRSFTAAQIRSQLPFMDAVTRYFAARCLLAAGQKDGLGILLNLEARRRDGGFPELDADLRDDLSIAVAQLVRRIRGRQPTDDMNHLFEWFKGLERVSPQMLPPPQLLIPATPR